MVFSIDSSSTGTGSISGNIADWLTMTGAGTIVIDANQAGNSNYNAAPQVQQTLSSSSSLPWTQFPAVVQLNVGSPHGLPIAFTWSVVAVSQLYDVQQVAAGRGAERQLLHWHVWRPGQVALQHHS